MGVREWAQKRADERWFRQLEKEVHRYARARGIPLEALNSWGGKPSQNLHQIMGQLPKTYEHAALTYLNHDGLSGALDVLCSSASSIPIQYYNRGSVERAPGDQGAWTISNSWIATSLRRANPLYGPVYHYFQTYLGLKLAGDYYWRFEPNSEYVWGLRPDLTQVITNNDGLPVEYKYKIENKEDVFKAEEVLHITTVNPLSDHYGASSVLSLALPIEADFFMQSYQRDFFRNSAVPRTLLVATESLGDEERDRFLAMWRKKYGGVGKSHGVALIEGSQIDVKNLADSMREADFINGRVANDAHIDSRIGTPPGMRSKSVANYATMREQKETFWFSTVLPLLGWVLDQLNAWDVAEAEDVIAVPDLWSHVQIRQILLMRLKDAVPLVQNGIMSINELRRGYNLPPNEWGDVWHKPFNLYPVDEEIPAASEPQKAVQSRPQRRLLKAEDEGEKRRRAKWKAFVGQTHEQEKEWVKLFLPEFVRQRDFAIENLADAIGEKEFAGRLKEAVESGDFALHAKAADDIEAALNQIFPYGEEEEVFTEIAKGEVEKLVKIHGQAGLDEVGDGVFDAADPNAVELVENKAFKFASEVNTTTQSQLREVLVDGFNEGKSLRDVADGVYDVFSQVDSARASRAMTIARTEVIGASNGGQIEGYRQSNVVEEKEWVASGGPNMRDSHAAMDGEIKKLNEPFSNGLMFPGDPNGPPEEVVNCECTLAPVVK